MKKNNEMPSEVDTKRRIKPSLVLPSKLSSKIVSFLGSRRFLIFIFVLFILQAGWIVMSSKFPLAYDENYHLSAIQAYEDTMSPFRSHQSESDKDLGDITRYGSYFYHYVMSFPGRLVEVFSSSLQVKVEVFRWINVAIFATAIFYVRRLILALGVSKATTNVSIFLFTLFPAVTFLAATINYDNLFMLLVWVHVYAAVKYHKSAYKSFGALGILITSGVAGSITKYSFLPILAATVITILASMAYRYKANTLKILRESVRQLKGWKRVALWVAIIVSIGLFAERYGYNIVTYRSPNPNCQSVQSVDSCLNWAPWKRNYVLDQAFEDQQPGVASFVQFTSEEWYPYIVQSLTFVGRTSDRGVATSHFAVEIGLLLLNILFVIGSFVLILVAFTKRYNLVLAGIIVMPIIIYTLALFGTNYFEYLSMGKPVAIQGRYLLWFLPLFIAFAAVGLNCIFSKLYKDGTGGKIALLTIVLIGFTQFGGLMTYWSNSHPTWFWPGNNVVIKTNETAKKIANKLILGN